MLFRNTFMSNILAAIAFALEIVDFPSEVAPGRSYTITYTPADDTPTTFILREGENANLGTITTLTEAATGGEFIWFVDSELPESTQYALEISRADGESNFAGPIALSDSQEPESTSTVETATDTRGAPEPSTTSQPPRETESQRSTRPSNSQGAPDPTDTQSNPGSSPPQTTRPTTQPIPPSTQPPSALGAGAIAGISVGAGVAGLLLGGGIILLVLYLRKKKRRQNGFASPRSGHPGVPEMGDQDRSRAGKKWFLGGKWRSEIGAGGVEQRQELDGRNVNAVRGPRAELYGELGK